MEARQKAAEKMKKLSRTKTDSVESNSMEDGGEGKPNVFYYSEGMNLQTYNLGNIIDLIR